MPLSVNTQSNGGGDPQQANANNGARPQFDNENPIDIVLVLLHQYPQIETWLQSMEYHGTVTSSRTHAVQFLTSLMDSQPQFTQLIKLIQQQLKSRRAQGIDPSQAAQQIIANGGGGGQNGAMQQQQMINPNMSAMNGQNNMMAIANANANANVSSKDTLMSDHDASRKKKRKKEKG